MATKGKGGPPKRPGTDVGVGKDVKEIKFEQAKSYKKTPKDIAYRRADIRQNPSKFPDVVKRYDSMVNRTLTKQGLKLGAAAGAFMGGYMAGDYINRKFNVSSKLADKAMNVVYGDMTDSIASSGRSKTFTSNAQYAGNDVDGGSMYEKADMRKPYMKKKKK